MLLVSGSLLYQRFEKDGMTGEKKKKKKPNPLKMSLYFTRKSKGSAI